MIVFIAIFLIFINSSHAKSGKCKNVQTFNKDNIERSKLIVMGEVILSKKGYILNIKKNWRTTETKFEIKNPEIYTDATGLPHVESVSNREKVLILSTLENSYLISLGACDPIIVRITSQQQENILTEEINKYLGSPKYIIKD